MLDLKLNDIPETVYKAVKALDNIRFGFLTIHGQGGKSMIDKAKKAADEIKSRPKIMMVTILTALNDEDLKAIGSNSTVNEQVEKLTKLAKETGVGIVCSGLEAKIVRKITTQKLKKCGLSRLKVRGIKELSIKFVNKSFNPKLIKNMNDEEAIIYLSSLRQIGRWSADMILLFTFNILSSLT